MKVYDWKVAKTEEGLQQVLAQIEECRVEGNQGELANGLLKLAYLVKWVRPDVPLDPFSRAQDLAEEALRIYREIDDRAGQVKALLATLPMKPPKEADRILKEANTLAAGQDDRVLLADVLAARGRAIGLRDREQSEACYLKALDIYRDQNDKGGQAQVHFCLIVASQDSPVRLAHALHAADLYEELGDHEDASRSILIGLSLADDAVPSEQLPELIQRGLVLARSADDESLIEMHLSRLANYEESQGNAERASQLRAEAEQLNEPDPRTPLEKWEEDFEFLEGMVELTKIKEDSQALAMFQEQLDELLKNKPT